MNVMIVDDNLIARATLKKLTERIDDLTLVAECSDAIEAYNRLQTVPVDLLLLDIEMPGMTGLELTENLGDKRPIIIFITSKRDYAVEAYDLNVADYIIKPVTPPRFLKAIEKVRELRESSEEETNVVEDEFLFIRDSTVVRRLKMDQILFAEAMGDYVKLYTKEKFYAIHNTLRALEQRLPAARFIRTHRSYIVAVDKIDTVKDGVLVIEGKPVPVADAYRAKVNSRMNIF